LDSSVEQAGSAPYFGECVEIKAEFNLEMADSVGFSLIDDIKEHIIKLDFTTRTIFAIDEQAKPQFLIEPNQLELHIFIDKSVIEIFINGRETFTTIFYPQLNENNALKISPFFIRAQGEVQIDFWTLQGTNPKNMQSERTHPDPSG